MNHLLIWEEIPETTKFFVLDPTKDAHLIEIAAKAHGHLINSGGEENEALNELNDLLDGRDPDHEPYEDSMPVFGAPFAAVYLCGLIL